MSNYTPTTNFTALTSAHAVINGAAYDLEYGNVATAITSKYDSSTASITLSSTLSASILIPTGAGTPAAQGISSPTATTMALWANATNVMTLGPGVQIGAPTGGDKGAGTLNVAGTIYVNGSSIVGTPLVTFGSSNPSITIAAANSGFVSTASGLTITIPSNATVPFAIGTTLIFNNQGGGTLSIALTTDTMTLASTVLTGTRSLVANGLATALKTGTTTWVISGAGLS